MSRPGVGNPGNKGGGRPSVKDTEWHLGLWNGTKGKKGENENWDVAALERKIASKKYVGRDVYALRVLKGDPSMLRNLADKVLATLVEHGFDPNKPLRIPYFGEKENNEVRSDEGHGEDQGNDETDSRSSGRNGGLENRVDSSVSSLPD